MENNRHYHFLLLDLNYILMWMIEMSIYYIFYVVDVYYHLVLEMFKISIDIFNMYIETTVT